MKRGALYWVNLEQGRLSEFGKTRPALIISNSDQNSMLPTVVILPLSTQPPEIWPLRLALKMPRGKESFVVIPGIRHVHKTRLQETIGLVHPSFLDRIDEALFAYLRD